MKIDLDRDTAHALNNIICRGFTSIARPDDHEIAAVQLWNEAYRIETGAQC